MYREAHRTGLLNESNLLPVCRYFVSAVNTVKKIYQADEVITNESVKYSTPVFLKITYLDY